MAKSKAKKSREHLVRAGKVDPLLSRGTHEGLYVRKTKTKTEKLTHHFQKYKKDLRRHENEGPFYLLKRKAC